jgi:type I phosphodiesterase/nucleotide pyrophosphatase
MRASLPRRPRTALARGAAAVGLSLLLGVGCTSAPDDERSLRARSSPSARETTAPVKRGWFRAACDLPLDYLRRIRRGTYFGRSPEVTIVPRKPHTFATFVTTQHTGPWKYLQEVPLIFYGPGFIKPVGSTTVSHEATVADLAPTVARLIDTPFPERRPGRVLEEILVPRRRRPPALVLNIVLDGGGWNVLRQWPDEWPFLAKMIEGGASIVDATIGSSPSVTPAIHTTMGTGTWPKRHGIVSIEQRAGDAIVQAYGGTSPRYQRVTSLADIYDPRTGNEAKIGLLAEKNWHMGMIGKGAYHPGGDKDIAVMITEEGTDLFTNPEFYYLPPYLWSTPGFEDDIRRIDAEDGKLDGSWRGVESLNDPQKLLKTPVWVLRQTTLIKKLLAEEGFGRDRVPDLFYTNYKEVDHLGHLYNMLGPEVRDTLRYTDAAIADLVQFLDRRVGRGRWVVTFTADHGQTPLPQSTGAWPIDIDVLEAAIARHFDVDVAELFQEERPHGLWLDRATMRREDITKADISQFVLEQTIADNAVGREVPDEYKDRLDEHIFAAAFPTAKLPLIWGCAKQRG